MERLTNKREADAQREDYERRLANGYPRNIPEERFLRLAAYEDSGVMPERVVWMKEVIEIAFDHDKSRAERAHELHMADKEGRVVVLPCKVGIQCGALSGAENHTSHGTKYAICASRTI